MSGRTREPEPPFIHSNLFSSIIKKIASFENDQKKIEKDTYRSEKELKLFIQYIEIFE